jgi:hypothetical protein
MAEYREGPEAKEKFEQTMRTILQAPKPATSKKQKRGKEIASTLRKPKRSDKD